MPDPGGLLEQGIREESAAEEAPAKSRESGERQQGDAPALPPKWSPIGRHELWTLPVAQPARGRQTAEDAITSLHPFGMRTRVSYNCTKLASSCQGNEREREEGGIAIGQRQTRGS